jgi:tetratricopeptide (TPR) repeat protein
MARKPCCPFIEMPTLYQKTVGHGLLILILLIGGWGCQSASTTSGKRKATIAQRFEKPATPVQPEVTADKPVKKPTPSGKHRVAVHPPVEKSVITVPPDISTPKSQLDLEFAIEQFRANQFEVAEYYLKKSLLASPDNPKTIRLLPWAYFFQKRYDKALMAFESARAHFPKEAEPLIGMGWSYVSMKFYERALGKFKQAESLSPDSYEVHKGLGFCNLFLAKEKAAQFHFKKIYMFGERDDLEEQWEQWRQGLPNKPVEVAPSHIRTASLFTLDIEAPRYRSMLSMFPGNQPEHHPALEEAWRLYRKKLFKRAWTAFRSLPQEAAQNLDARNGLAWSLLKIGNLIEAEKIFNDTWKQNDRFIGTRLGILEVKKILQAKASVAKHYFDIQKYRIAEDKFAQLHLNYPDWSYPYSALGWIKLKRGEEEEALKHFETALDKDSKDPAALEGMRHLKGTRVSKLYQADQKMREGDYKNASYLYFDYVQEHQSNPTMTFALAKAYSGLGFSQIGKKQYPLAIQNFEKIRVRGEYESHWTKGLGIAYYHLGQYEKAAKNLIVADTLTPNQKEIVYKLDWSILRSWDTETAKEYFLAKARRKPLRASVYMAIGWIEHQHGDPDLGVEYFLKAISLDPEIAASDDFKGILAKERFGWQVYNYIGWAYYHRDQSEDSIKMFNTALASQPRSSEALKGLGYNFYKLKKWEEAETYLKKSLKRNPKTHPVTEKNQGNEPGLKINIMTSARTKLARALLQQNKHQEALKYWLEELNQHPDWPEVHDGLGWTYLKLNRLAESREAFNQAIRHQPLNPLSHKGLKEVKYRLALRSL